MIRFKLASLLADNKMKQNRLAELTGIRPATISKMYYGEVKRIQVDQMDKICKVFDCKLTDFMEYIPSNDK